MPLPRSHSNAPGWARIGVLAVILFGFDAVPPGVYLVRLAPGGQSVRKCATMLD